MKLIYRTVLCSLILTPAAVFADEPQLGGQAVLGYGDVDGEDDTYGILDVTLENDYDFDSFKLNWDLRGRVRTDQDDIGKVENNLVDAAVELDFGAYGKLGFTTFIDSFDQKPWADGDLFNRGSVGVFPVIQKRYDGVRDSQFTAGGPNGQKVDPDLLLTYSNRVAGFGIDFTANALQTWDGYEKSEMADEAEEFALAELKLTKPTEGFGIYSLLMNDIGDAEAQIVFPMPKQGLTLIGRYSINEGNFDEYRANFVAIYRAKDMGLFKGAFFAHALNDDASRSVLSVKLGYEDAELKIAGDTDGDYALEGSYALSEKSSIQFGWDNGFENTGGPGDGFDDYAFPAPVFAAGRGEAFEIAFVQKF